MDYKKLTEESLDEIMRQIRVRNNTAKPEVVTFTAQPVNEVKKDACACLIETNADMAIVEQYLADAAIGREIGIKKSPMHKQRGIRRKIARLVEKVYLRVAEFSNRYVRSFNISILSIASVLKERVKVLFRNDSVLWENMERMNAEKDALTEEIKYLKASVEDRNNQLEKKLQEAMAQSVEEKLGQYNAEQKNALAHLEARLLEQMNVADGIAVQLQEYSSAVMDIKAQIGDNCSVTEGIASQLEENRHTTAELEASLQEKTAVLVDQLNRQMLMLRDLEEKISATAAKVKWTNGGARKTVENEGHDSGDVLNDPVFYHDFEERFRGTQDDIRERLAYYLPTLLNHFGNLEDKRFVDIGCGRGEWLDMIAANGAKDYVGVDINPVQIEICKQKGHPTVMQNCMDYLAGLSDESVDMISGIQIIEHLSLDNLLALLAECHRVLRPQGMILFETPNSSNMITASNWFYIDPTHNRPIHKEFARFLAERSGYTNVDILELNPAKYAKTLVNPICFDGNQVVWDENIEILNNLLYGPQDYAIVGVKGNG